VARGFVWRDPDTGRILSFEQFAKKADAIARDLQKALTRQQKAGQGLLDARSQRSERMYAKSLARARQETARQQARQAKIDAALFGENPQHPGRSVIPSRTEWELSVRYTSRKSGPMHLAIRLRRSDGADIPADDARAALRRWRRDTTLPPQFEIFEIDWSKGGRVYHYGPDRAEGDAGVSAQPIIASTPLDTMRIGRVRQ
jgi:hypothetical protein